MSRHSDGNIGDDARHALAVAAGDESANIRIDLEGSCVRREGAKGEGGEDSNGLEGEHFELG